MLHAAEVADEINKSSLLGFDVALNGIDGAALANYRTGVIDRLYRGLHSLVDASGITVVSGTARMTGANTVTVGDARFKAPHVVLATGSTPNTLGLSIGGRILTSTEALALDYIPNRVVIVGGSVIGVEFASAWRSLGSEVTVVEGLGSLVPLEDPAIGKQLQQAFRKRRIAVRVGTKFTDVTQDEHGAVVTLEDGSTIDADVVLIAAGRAPASANLGLGEVGVNVDRGWVCTDANLLTNLPGVYAVGDLVRGLQLAHRGYAHGVFVAEHISGRSPRPVFDSDIPRVTYCDPEIASVGLTEPQAKTRFGDEEVQSLTYHLAGNGRSQVLGTNGFVKILRRKDGPILGVHMIGARIGEQSGEAALLVRDGRIPEDVADFVHAHPTQNEAIGEALMALAGKPLHTHG